MARSIPADRFSAIVAASARVFIAHGYQRTQVQDVADALALAKGTLYGYAQGKAALFAAAVRYGDAQEALPLASELPVAAVARTIVELCALWAVHLHFDPSPEPWSIVQPGVIDDDAIAATLAEFVVRATTASSD
ncbi:helix-turn-helix domain-containing protein [Mycobacterium tuberculosis]